MTWVRRHPRALLVATLLAGSLPGPATRMPDSFVAATLNGVTLAALYFLVASGFAPIFGLMRNVNLAHGSALSAGRLISEYTSAT